MGSQKILLSLNVIRLKPTLTIFLKKKKNTQYWAMKIKAQEITIICLQILRLGPRSNHYNIRPFCKPKYKNNELRTRSVLRIHEDKVRKHPKSVLTQKRMQVQVKKIKLKIAVSSAQLVDNRDPAIPIIATSAVSQNSLSKSEKIYHLTLQ